MRSAARRRLSGCIASSGQAQPCLGRLLALDIEVNRAQLENLQRWFDRRDHVACRSARWTSIARWSFGAADQADPAPAWREQPSHALGKARTFVGFVEHVPAAAVKREIERSAGRVGGKKIDYREASTFAGFRARHLDRARCDVDAENIETVLRQPHGVCASSAADIESAAGNHKPCSHDLDEILVGLAAVPRQLAARVLCIPIAMGHRQHISRMIAFEILAINKFVMLG